MKFGVVEGEPGIFPAPVARVLTRFNRWLRRRLGAEDQQPLPPEQGDDGRDKPNGA